MKTLYLSLLVLAVAMTNFACSSDGPRELPDPPEPTTQPATQPKAGDKATAVFAGGCFWCVEAVYEKLEGVSDVVSGYAGGKPETADYKKVSAGLTEHAEVVKVTYDPSKISYGELLKVFFATHFPTQLNRQGPDYGKQYRSAVFYQSDAEKKLVEAYIKKLTDEKVYDKPIVTTLEKLQKFHPAEDYHQDFVRLNPNHGYILQNVPQKIQKLKKVLPDKVKK